MAPQWAFLVVNQGESSDWVLTPPLIGGGSVGPYAIRIWTEEGVLCASETPPGRDLPAVCPELHINPGGDFCLGALSFRADVDEEVAGFWQALGEFLHNQQFARRKRHWPAGRWLSHGRQAALAQLRAEAIADRSGLADDYAEWLECSDGWLGQILARKDQLRALLSSNQNCPRGCRGINNVPTKLRACSRRSALKNLADIEQVRLQSQERYYRALHQSGVTCCHRVDGCGLARLEEAAA